MTQVNDDSLYYGKKSCVNLSWPWKLGIVLNLDSDHSSRK